MEKNKERLLKDIVEEARIKIDEVDRERFDRSPKHEEFIDVPKFKMVRDGVLHVPATDRISAPEVAVNLIRNEIQIQQNHFGDRNEYMVLTLLNAENYPILTKTIGVGTSDEVRVDPAVVWGLILSPHFTAKGFVLGHNHPTGRIFLSDEDKAVLAEFKRMGDYFHVPLRDFIVIGDGTDKFYSHRNANYEL